MKLRKCILGAAVMTALGGVNATANVTAQPAFDWASSAPLISPQTIPGQTIYGVKDPSIVYVDGRYHVFMTTAGSAGWGLAYTSFVKWSDASSAKIVQLDTSPMGPGYRAAPQVFYFAPQKT